MAHLPLLEAEAHRRTRIQNSWILSLLENRNRSDLRLRWSLISTGFAAGAQDLDHEEAGEQHPQPEAMAGRANIPTNNSALIAIIADEVTHIHPTTRRLRLIILAIEQ
jgi:hypothetical protein